MNGVEAGQRAGSRRGGLAGAVALAFLAAWIAPAGGAAAQPAPAYEEAPYDGALETTGEARLRQEPDARSATVRTVARGARLAASRRISAYGQVWYRVAEDGKAAGYVAASQVRPVGPPPAAASPATASPATASPATASPATASQVAPAGVVSGDDQIEMMFWSSIKDSRSPADFRAYLDKFPRGHFAEIARLREAEFASPPARPPGAGAPPLADPQARGQVAAAVAARLSDWPFDGDWRGKIRRTELNDLSQRHNCPDATLDFTVADGQIVYGKLNVIGISMTFATANRPGGAAAAAADAARTASKFGRLSFEGVVGKDGVIEGVKLRAYDFLGSNFINYTLTGRADGKGIEGRWRADLNACSGVFVFGRADGSAVVQNK